MNPNMPGKLRNIVCEVGDLVRKYVPHEDTAVMDVSTPAPR